jgi:CRISPR-associated protein Csb2
MQKAICISATFLTGRYHGEEWPPSPARLLQALVAGIKTGGYRLLWPEAEGALRWLEHRPAPVILAVPEVKLQRYRLAVPNNDMDTVAREWAAGKTADPAKLRTMKDVAPRLTDGNGPHVRYLWALDAGDDAEKMAAFAQRLSHCLYAFGWGVDMAYADAEVRADAPEDGYEEWAPSRSRGKQLAVPVPGFLDDLEATYQRFTKRTQTMDTDTRPTVYRLQRYERRGAPACPFAVFGLRTPAGDSGLSRRWDEAMEVAGWLRHASAQALEGDVSAEEIAGFVLGHGQDGGGASFRLAYVPLPSIGHAHGDGRIRRAMLVEPATADGTMVDRLALKLAGAVLTDSGGNPACTLGPLPDERVMDFYTGQAQVWRSVTPVILHGFNALRGQISLTKTENLLLRAFEMAGYAAGAIESFAFQPAPLWPGTGAAREMRAPRHLLKYPRYHVEVQFRNPVTGPVLAGIGRHYGIGVFAAAGGG